MHKSLWFIAGLVLAGGIGALHADDGAKPDADTRLTALADSVAAMERDVYWKRPFTWRHRDALSDYAGGLRRLAHLAEKAQTGGESVDYLDPPVFRRSTLDALEDFARIVQARQGSLRWPQRDSDEPQFLVDMKRLEPVVGTGAIRKKRLYSVFLDLVRSLEMGELSATHAHFVVLRDAFGL